MDVYTEKTMSWLDDRFRKTDSEGVYYAHQPIYGFRRGHCEPLMSFRYLITLGILKSLSKYKIDSLLDVGAAEGYKAAISQTLLGIKTVECCDISAEAAKRAQEIFGVRSGQADVHNLPYEDDQFDAIICSEMLEHVTDYSKAAAELARVSKKIIVITVPNEKPEHAEQVKRSHEIHGHINSFSSSSFDFMNALGWDVYHTPMISSNLRIVRLMVDAEEKLPLSNKRGLKKTAAFLFNNSKPLFRLFWNRYLSAASLRMDSFASKLFNGYDGHLFLMTRRGFPLPLQKQKKISALDVLRFSVPLHHIEH